MFIVLLIFYLFSYLWIFYEPILPLHLNGAVHDSMVPMYFLMPQVGYLIGSTIVFGSKQAQSADSKKVIMRSLLVITLALALYPVNRIYILPIGLFIFGFASTFTKIPSYKMLTQVIETNYPNENQKHEVTDKTNSLSLLFKNVSQITTPLIVTWLHMKFGFETLCMYSIILILCFCIVFQYKL